MDDRRKTIAAMTFVCVFVFFIILVAGVLIARRKSVVSPVPEEGAIRIIFLTPTPSFRTASPSATRKP